MRLYGDGRVVWVGVGYVAVIGRVESRIDASAVLTLLERARAGKFWSLCAEYVPAGTDLPSENVAIATIGRIKAVAGNSGNQPQFLSELAAAIDAAADTHRWRHGDPKLERFLGCPDGFGGPCDHLAEDGYGHKSGVSSLMRAAAQSDLGQVKALLQQGVDPNEHDVSGWTALMYAARCALPAVVSALLNAGADPKVQSNAGQLARDAVVGKDSREKLNLLSAAGGNRP